MAEEQQKRTNIRKLDPFFTEQVFVGRGIDGGAGDDLINKNGEFKLITSVTSFDKEDGDLEKLDEYFPENHFDWLASSQSLEHMENPKDALKRWIKVVKPNGYLAITIPDFDLYEKRQFPSIYNNDHRAYFHVSRDPRITPNDKYIVVDEWLEELKELVIVERLSLIDTNFDYSPEAYYSDQTREGAEAFIEFILLKK